MTATRDTRHVHRPTNHSIITALHLTYPRYPSDNNPPRNGARRAGLDVMPRPRGRDRDLPLAQRILAPSASARPLSPNAAAAAAAEHTTLPPLFPHPSPSPSAPLDPSSPSPSSPSPAASAPPATFTSDPAAALLHARIYHLIALALRAYIQQWYARLSRDTTLLPTINEHVVAPIATRLLALDRGRVHTLLLAHVPTIAATHLRTLRAARASVEAGFAGSAAEAYHARLPLRAVALTPIPSFGPEAEDQLGTQGHGQERAQEYALSPTYLTALADALLASTLPEPEYASDAERLIVREVVARSVLGNIGKRLCAPWFWSELGLKLLTANASSTGYTSNSDPDLTPLDTAPALAARLGAHAAHALDALTLLWSRLTSTLVFLWSTAIFLTAAWSGAPPPPSKGVLDPWLVLLHEAALFLSPPSGPSLALRLSLNTLDALAILARPAADRLAPYLLDMVLTPTTGVRVVNLLERVLFPDGWPGPPPVEPSAEEAKEMQARLRAVLDERVKLGVVGMEAGRGVDVLSDGGCNAHLVGMLLDAIVLTLLPGLGAEGRGDEKAGLRIEGQEKPAIEHNNKV